MTTRPQNDDSTSVESISVNLPHTNIPTNRLNSVSNIDISQNDEHINIDNYDKDEYSEQADQETASDQGVPEAAALTDIDIDATTNTKEVLDKPSNDKISMVRNSELGIFDDEYADEEADRFGRHHSGYGSDTGSDDTDMDDDDRDEIKTHRRKHPETFNRGHKLTRVRDEAYRDSELFPTAKKSASKYGNSDSIKVISTPHGKVSIVYQSSATSKQNVTKSDSKKQPLLTEQGKQQKITPVLTPDGKVALLYRGASDISTNNKYEPIVNVPSPKTIDENPLQSNNGTINADNGMIKSTVNQTLIHESPVTTDEPREPEVATTKEPIHMHFPLSEPSGRNSNEEENVILPNINRPPSEVLGIKKNQFIQFRITDGVVTATPAISGRSESATDSTPSPPPNRVSIRQDDIVPNFEYDYESNGESRENDPMAKNDQMPRPPRINDDDIKRSDSKKLSNIFSKTEVVNLAIIPSFDNEAKTNTKSKAVNSDEMVFDINSHQLKNGKTSVENNEINDNRLYHHRHPQLDERDLSAIHCAMQALVAIAAIATIFGMVGAYFKQRVFDQITSMH